MALGCPRCTTRLAKTKTDKGFIFRCRNCDGRSAALSILRRELGREYVNKMWRNAMEGVSQPGAKCPACRKPMAEVPLTVPRENLRLDLCTRCQLVWFDAGEFQQVPAKAPSTKADTQLSQRAREEIALQRVKQIGEEARASEPTISRDAPEDPWKWIPAILGMPIEEEVSPVKILPWATWGLSAALVMTFIATISNLPEIVMEWGLIPAQMLRHGGLTLITGFFLHAGIFHLIGNTYFLMVFGDNVEDALGRLRFVVLVVLAAIVGDLIHVIADPASTIPCIGASGGISGIIVFYPLKYPHARLAFFFHYWLMFRWIRLPAYGALVLWAIMQTVGVFMQIKGLSNVSALAHVGGATVGAIAWYVWRDD